MKILFHFLIKAPERNVSNKNLLNIKELMQTWAKIGKLIFGF